MRSALVRISRRFMRFWSLLFVTIRVSSAYLIFFMILASIVSPFSISSIVSVNISSEYKLENSGDGIHPCRTPAFYFHFFFGLVVYFHNSSLFIICRSLSPIFIALRILRCFSYWTLSNAFLKSVRQEWTSQSALRHLWIWTCSPTSTSRVPGPYRNANCVFPAFFFIFPYTLPSIISGNTSRAWLNRLIVL